MASERMAVRRWIFQTLNADKGAGGLVEILRKGEAASRDVPGPKIFQNRASEKAKFPFVVISYVSGDDTNSIGSVRVCSDMTFQIAVESEDNTVFDEEGAVNQIEALLHGVLKEDAFPRFTCERIGEADENVFGSALSTRMAGGQYRFLINGED